MGIYNLEANSVSFVLFFFNVCDFVMEKLAFDENIVFVIYFE